MMLLAKMRRPELSIFGLTGPQSKHVNEPETALFGSQITANTLCIPLPNSITNLQVRQSTQLSRVLSIQERLYDQFPMIINLAK